ncbi:MAG: thioredoxin family protein [Myxococcota bacterium]
MAVTPSTMLDLGTKAPDFTLPDPEGRDVTLSDFDDAKAVVVMFICNHCPYVLHIADALGDFARRYQDRGVAFVAINANDAERYPADSPPKMADMKAAHGWPFPYLFDQTQAVAKAYRAACTPDFYLFDGDRKLVYRGQFDTSRPGNHEPVDGHALAAAIDALLAGTPAPEDQVPSMGCNIKWKPGHEPDYF